MRFHHRPLIPAALLVLLFLFVLARIAAPAAVSDDIRLPITEHTLKNGMRFLIVERRESPTFAAYLRFQVGSANETPGSTGLAHLLEHMMFKGTIEERKRVQAVTQEEVVAAAKRYLVSRQRTVAWLVRGQAPASGPPARRDRSGLQPWDMN